MKEVMIWNNKNPIPIPNSDPVIKRLKFVDSYFAYKIWMLPSAIIGSIHRIADVAERRQPKIRRKITVISPTKMPVHLAHKGS